MKFLDHVLVFHLWIIELFYIFNDVNFADIIITRKIKGTGELLKYKEKKKISFFFFFYFKKMQDCKINNLYK